MAVCSFASSWSSWFHHQFVVYHQYVYPWIICTTVARNLLKGSFWWFIKWITGTKCSECISVLPKQKQLLASKSANCAINSLQGMYYFLRIVTNARQHSSSYVPSTLLNLPILRMSFFLIMVNELRFSTGDSHMSRMYSVVSWINPNCLQYWPFICKVIGCCELACDNDVVRRWNRQRMHTRWCWYRYWSGGKGIAKLQDLLRTV